MRKKISSWFLLIGLVFALAGCGGGGGGSSSDNNNPPVIASTAKTVAGVAFTDTGIAEEASVSVKSYDVSGTSVESLTAATDAAGRFSSSVKMADSGGYVVVEVKKDGYTDSSERIDFTAPSDFNSVRADLMLAQTVVANVSDAGIVFGAAGAGQQSPGMGQQAFVFGIVRYPDGTRKALAGSKFKAARAAGAGATSELEIVIPVSSVPAGTTSLTGKFQTFDSSNPDDAKYFPGEYKDANGNKLVSLAFDYINISDTATGQSLGSLVAKARAAGKLGKADAATAPKTVVTRYIPSGSCANILRDEDTAKNGYQISVYIYNGVKGYWDFVGQGTVLSNSSVVTADQFSVASCQSAGYDLQVEVVNDYFVSNHWNLDQAILTQNIKEVCVSGTVKDENGTPVSGIGLSLYDDNTPDSKQSFIAEYEYTGSSGSYSLKTVLTDSTDTDRTATISYYDPDTYSYGTQTVTLGESSSCGTADITVTKPSYSCTVTGKVKDTNGLPLAGKDYYVYGYSAGYFYANGETGSDGSFTETVPCVADLIVYTGGSFTQFNVNASLATAEYTDSGSAVVLKDVTLSATPGTLTISVDGGVAQTYEKGSNDYGWPYFYGVKYINSADSTQYFLILTFSEFITDDEFSIGLWQFNGPGTYTLSSSCSATNPGTWALYDDWDETSNEWVSYDAGCGIGSGSVTITEFGDVGGRIKGTFNFTGLKEYIDATDDYGTRTKSVSGSFDVPRIGDVTGLMQAKAKAGKRMRKI